MEHAILPPSSASIWVECTGWRTMVNLYPDNADTSAAKEGRAAHELAERMIADATKGLTPPYVSDDEITEGAQTYAADVVRFMRKSRVFGGRDFGTETRLDMPAIHPEVFGTIDQFIYDHKARELFLWDFKFGHKVVDAFENWQLIAYYAGLREYLELNGFEDQKITVHFRIVQPRAYHRKGPIRSWTTKASNLRPYVNQLHMAAHTSLNGDGKLKSGNHCRYCSARFACPAAHKAAGNYLEATMVPIAEAPTPLELGVELGLINRAINALDYLKTGYEAHIEGLLRNSKAVPGWNLAPGRGQEAWKVSPEQVFTLGDTFGIDLRQNKPLTPKQAIKAGIQEEIVKAVSHRPNKGVSLQPINAKEVFSK